MPKRVWGGDHCNTKALAASKLACTPLSGGGKEVAYIKTLESAEIPFTLRMAKTKTMVLVFGFSFPFSAGFQGKSGSSFGKKWF